MSGRTIRRALVTGGSRGIGHAIAAELRRRGIEVDTPGRDTLDLASPVSLDNYTAKLRDAPVDILVNNAGLNDPVPFEEIDMASWETLVQVNLTAPLRLIQACSPGMKQAGWGRIVNISSIFSLVTKEKRAAYSTLKSGLNGLTRTVAVELAPHGILVNALCPGYVATDLTRKNNSPQDLEKIAALIPMGRLAEPTEIAAFTGWLCSPENSYLTGQSLVVDGGFTCR